MEYTCLGEDYICHSHTLVYKYIYTHTHIHININLFFKIQVNNLVAERCCKEHIIFRCHSHVSHNFIIQPKITAILKSTWVTGGHFDTTARFKTTVLYTKVVSPSTLRTVTVVIQNPVWKTGHCDAPS